MLLSTLLAQKNFSVTLFESGSTKRVEIESSALSALYVVSSENKVNPRTTTSFSNSFLPKWFLVELRNSSTEVLDTYYNRSCNQVYNILRLFDVLPNFPFTTSEAMGDYYL